MEDHFLAHRMESWQKQKKGFRFRTRIYTETETQWLFAEISTD